MNDQFISESVATWSQVAQWNVHLGIRRRRHFFLFWGKFDDSNEMCSRKRQHSAPERPSTDLHKIILSIVLETIIE